jgi:hypothetical protein
MRSLNFFAIYLILAAAIWLWESIQPLTEMITRKLPGGKERPASKADKLTAICEPIVYKMWESRRLTPLWASTACYREDFTTYYNVPYCYNNNKNPKNLKKQAKLKNN